MITTVPKLPQAVSSHGPSLKSSKESAANLPSSNGFDGPEQKSTSGRGQLFFVEIHKILKQFLGCWKKAANKNCCFD
jgi:hypothetical protein